MLTPQDRHFANKRKRLWDVFGWTYMGIKYLSKNGSVNCGCGMCKSNTYQRRLKRKRERISARMELKLSCSPETNKTDTQNHLTNETE